MKVRDDAGQDGTHDRLVQGGEEEAEQDRDQDLDSGSIADVDRGVVDGRRRGGPSGHEWTCSS